MTRIGDPVPGTQPQSPLVSRGATARLPVAVLAAAAAAAACLLADFAAGQAATPPVPRPHPRAAQAAAEAAPAAAVAAQPAAALGTAPDVPLPRPHPTRKPGEAAAAQLAAVAAAANPQRDLIGGIIGGAGALMSLAERPEDVTQLPIVTAIASGELAFKSAYQRLQDGDFAGAARLAQALPDKADTLLVEWLIATSGKPEVSADRIAKAIGQLDGWPGQSLMQLRLEQAVVRSRPDAASVVRMFADRLPTSDSATLLLARSYLALGRRDQAAAVIGPFWRDNTFSAATEKDILADFGALLTPADHRYRVARLLYDGRNDDAKRTAQLIDADRQKLAGAWILVNQRNSKAGAALEALPASMKREAGYFYARALLSRRAGRISEAARWLIEAPKDVEAVVDMDAWSSERRAVARALVDRGDPRTAYRVIAEHAAATRLEQVEIEFQAGWVALRYLRDPKAAANHFKALAAASTAPLSQSRAAYWLGRSADVAGNAAEAEAAYQRAASYQTTFYGQLAMARLKMPQIALSAPPPPDTAAQAEFTANPLVRAVDRLIAVGESDDAELFARYLADTLESPAQIALLTARAEARGQHQLALQIGKLAQVRGLPVDELAFPTAAVPSGVPSSYAEKPVVYAIARQESAFNPAAISRAGARGLLQLMPATARQTAREIGMAYSESRLTTDAQYNATLGAAHLGSLFQEYGGSYVMTFAAYNAGKRRVSEWVAAFGDPRDPKIDVIDWIERIPIGETRNYVQRTMENLQVYRVRFGNPALTIEADLRHGRRG